MSRLGVALQGPVIGTGLSAASQSSGDSTVLITATPTSLWNSNPAQTPKAWQCYLLFSNLASGMQANQIIQGADKTNSIFAASGSF